MSNSTFRERWALIANPASGGGNKRRLMDKVASHLREAGCLPEVLWTTRRGHAEELARQAAKEGFAKIVACGGDGTIHEIVNGIMSSRSSTGAVTLGIVPTGTGNDLARELRIPTGLSGSVNTLLNGKVNFIDLGKAGDRYFHTVATLGFSAAVSRYAMNNKLPGIFPAAAVYLYAALMTLFRYQAVTVRLNGDLDAFEGPVFLAAVGNTKCYGGGMKIAPSAVIDDGRLNLCLVRQLSRLKVARMLPRVFSGRHTKCSEVSMHRFGRMEVMTKEPVDIWADGEFVARTPAVFQIIPHALPVLTP